ARGSIGEPVSPLVEDDHASEGAQAGQRFGKGRELPPDVEVAHEARYEDDVEGSVANDLVRDRQVPALGIASCRRAAHDQRVSQQHTRMATDPAWKRRGGPASTSLGASPAAQAE